MNTGIGRLKNESSGRRLWPKSCTIRHGIAPRHLGQARTPRVQHPCLHLSLRCLVRLHLCSQQATECGCDGNGSTAYDATRFEIDITQTSDSQVPSGNFVTWCYIVRHNDRVFRVALISRSRRSRSLPGGQPFSRRKQILTVLYAGWSLWLP